MRLFKSKWGKWHNYSIRKTEWNTDYKVYLVQKRTHENGKVQFRSAYIGRYYKYYQANDFSKIEELVTMDKLVESICS